MNKLKALPRLGSKLFSFFHTSKKQSCFASSTSRLNLNPEIIFDMRISNISISFSSSTPEVTYAVIVASNSLLLR